jgi:hypothetical protein
MKRHVVSPNWRSCLNTVVFSEKLYQEYNNQALGVQLQASYSCSLVTPFFLMGSRCARMIQIVAYATLASK